MKRAVEKMETMESNKNQHFALPLLAARLAIYFTFIMKVLMMFHSLGKCLVTSLFRKKHCAENSNQMLTFQETYFIWDDASYCAHCEYIDASYCAHCEFSLFILRHLKL